MDKPLLLDHANAERILQEGWRLFQQRGYRGVTVDELCQRCQLSKPTLYYYFKDKENLFVQVLQFQLANFRTVAEQPGTLRERLQTLALAIFTSFQKEYSPLLRDREHIKKPENRKKIRDAFRSGLFGPLIVIMKSGLDSGELKDENPETLTLLFLGMINFFIGKAEELKLDPAALAAKLTSYFFEGAQKT